ncbi:PE-PPE domain-containing protein [Candidatus Mycobacterium wuenschmannii]|uniref:PE-PPE domain-containing protein n=1 Tax=Candidatus Mycobacterium wuenschmannii TaxID=3027808 RepID=A0ABY8W1J6_9MYCO|nr:PE-PPE domain-containing protein [Candidatus Mycobacterium wuenschmannii]WIM89446.1 PE-PPE domain-containing protein [Candidatus Mycobacterium wuenschmannii]
MKKLLAGVSALVTVGATGCFGVWTASADGPEISGPPSPGAPGDQTAYALGGAHVLGVPYDNYIRMEGAEWFPGQQRQIVRYPAGQVQGHVLAHLFPGLKPDIDKVDQQFPGIGLDGPSVGQSVAEGVDNLDNAIRTTGRPGTAIGLSEGGFVVDGEQLRLANHPETGPPPNALNFATFGDPIGRHAWGQSFLRATYPVGANVPALDFVMTPEYESQYDTNRFVAAYDSIADFPDRPDNMFAFANTLMGLATGHTAVAFTNASMVPPGNIRTTINSRGAKDTTIMVPQQHLPLVMPLKYIGIPEDTLNKLDAILIPRVNAGYIRNDDPATAPVQVDPVHGFDPAVVTAPTNQATFGGGADPLSQALSGALSVLSHGASQSAN